MTKPKDFLKQHRVNMRQILRQGQPAVSNVNPELDKLKQVVREKLGEWRRRGNAV